MRLFKSLNRQIKNMEEFIMRLQELNFENLISEKRRIITYGKDGNSVIKPYRTVYCID